MLCLPSYSFSSVSPSLPFSPTSFSFFVLFMILLKRGANMQPNFTRRTSLVFIGPLVMMPVTGNQNLAKVRCFAILILNTDANFVFMFGTKVLQFCLRFEWLTGDSLYATCGHQCCIDSKHVGSFLAPIISRRTSLRDQAVREPTLFAQWWCSCLALPTFCAFRDMLLKCLGKNCCEYEVI